VQLIKTQELTKRLEKIAKRKKKKTQLQKPQTQLAEVVSSSRERKKSKEKIK
jgi:hypothetical protein